MKKFIVSFVALAFVFSMNAQENRAERNDRIKSLKIAFITDNLKLSPADSEKFWPIYNEYETEEDKIRSNYHSDKPIDEMTDAEATVYLDQRIKSEEQLWKLKKKYISDLKGVLTPKQTASLLNMDREFKKKMLRSIQDNRKGSKSGGHQ